MPPPRLLTCYLCGREFGTSSLGIHVPQCQKKWIDQESQKDPRERRPLPEAPKQLASGGPPKTAQEIAEYNSQANKQFEEKCMNGCPYCNRTFSDEAWVKHQRICSAARPFRPAGTGLGKESLSVKTEPGAISGTARKKLSSTPIQKPHVSEPGSAVPAAHIAAASITKPPALKTAQRPGTAGLEKLEHEAAVINSALSSGDLRANIPGATASAASLPSSAATKTKVKKSVTVEQIPVATVAEPSAPAAAAVAAPALASSSTAKFEKMLDAAMKAGAGAPGSGAGKIASAPRIPAGKAGMGGMSAKPRGYTCYLCGQQYGSNSLKIHIPQCQEMWVKKEEWKPKRERRPVPPPPPELDADLPTNATMVDQFNATMSDYWNKVCLTRCPGCNRTFTDEAMEHHRNSCKALPEGRMGGSGMLTGGGGFTSKPRGYSCYLCGQQYGSASLKIHIPQCRVHAPSHYCLLVMRLTDIAAATSTYMFLLPEKREKVEAAKLPSERRPIPLEPAELEHDLPTSAADVDAFNARMFDYYNNRSLVGCPNCGRTFTPEALAHHAKACKVGKPMKGPGGGTINLTASAASSTASGGYMCYLCGLTAGAALLPTHIPVCQAKWVADRTKPDEPPPAVPPAPAELSEPLPTDAPGIAAFNERMLLACTQASLQACPGCGRTFRPDALAKHAKGCKGKR
ncbi:hypothetical protein WJX74_008848 [Apatococcus lobatus]|uniref:C2HC/C3H-type domain-containing protein n=1 Tax=Apatococcus lobatus TaxID=904363 RepID=A0AAW1QV03_9CHLO